MRDKDAFKDLFKTLGKTLNPADWPQLVAPYVEVLQNKTAFGNPIEFGAMKYKKNQTLKVHPWTQKWAVTSSKFLTDNFGWELSPVQIEYMVKQYSGGMIHSAIGGFDWVRDWSDDPTESIGSRVKDKLVLRFPHKPRRQVQRIYNDYFRFQRELEIIKDTKSNFRSDPKYIRINREAKRYKAFIDAHIKPVTSSVREIQFNDKFKGSSIKKLDGTKKKELIEKQHRLLSKKINRFLDPKHGGKFPFIEGKDEHLK